MSTSPLCPECGSNPCYNICPTQDPYQGDQAREDADYAFNAAYDDVRERYASTAADAEMFYEDDLEYEDVLAEATEAREAELSAETEETFALWEAEARQGAFDPADGEIPF